MNMLCMTPFAPDKNLGRAYNEAMSLLPEDGWAILQDHDSMATTPHWYRQFAEAIAFKPEAGAIVATTNRIASPWQRRGDPKCNDIEWHRRYGAERLSIRTLLDITCTKGFGGVMFALSKRAWQECGGFAHGLYCCDHSLFFRLVDHGRRVYLHEGIYVFHVRASSDARPPMEAPKVEGCRCRGAETLPTQRIALP